MRRSLFIISLGMISIGGFAQQQVLSYQDAITQALSNNFDIVISKTNLEIASNLNTPGNAGMLPVIDAGGTYTKSTQNIEQNLSSGQTTNRSGVASSSMNAAVNLNWTVFDGLSMFMRKKQLVINQYINYLDLRRQVQATMEQVSVAYLDIVLKQQQLDFIQQLIDVLNNQKKIVDAKFKAGLASRQDVLYINIELNNQRAEQITQQNLLNQMKRNLLVLISSAGNTDFKVESDSAFMDKLTPKMQGVSANPQLMIAQKSIEATQIKRKEYIGYFFPKIDVFASYALNRSESQAGFLLLNQSLGFNYGASFSIPLFSGFRARKIYQNVLLENTLADLQFRKLQLQLKTDYEQLMMENTTVKALMDLQHDNSRDAEENYMIANQRYEKGVISIIELKEAQRLLETSKYAYLQSKYTYNTNFVRLKSLSGEFVN